ncbi:MAG: UDP-glucose 4-epimerase GalE [Clostridiales bacterium]|jgi:UDP-glucose 4-epimerase|nr:UDP-glucose 4-epimerase GalE [Clostridiales bacterium]
MTILVCGGAGYIGSHTVAELLDKGHEVIVADNLETGHKAAVWPGAQLITGDLRDETFANRLFSARNIDAVIDFAAYSLVGESMNEPLKYYKNNVGGVINLLEAMKNNQVRYIVFSSTAAVYGEPDEIPILETAPTNPTNPYGETKLAVEKALKWAESAFGLRYAALRYFNVAGAHISGEIGEDHRPETHLIPNALKTQLHGGALKLFGDDYPTPDGTCVRDYIHVTDLADAHILALEKIRSSDKSDVYNLGNGSGFSNKQIIRRVEKVTGKPLRCDVAPRRPGDPASLVASSDKIIKELGWKPKYASLETIIETAWAWISSHPNGFPE